ncbi:hypothetical protein DAEQUDRAFT_758107 [Daedalea quercina L-15889]|uniref:Uncharacterized protein n=1 Tax=Daedalea quercina L-15889 TaxID=1314783 RepID=A0A165NYV2_9APHY|nr:hypothetical protein DAEQUDRAFT_758107 [Daedalea quercina L-15889]
MWILTGPFDCEEHEIPTKTKSKLLKTGVTYILGRKEDAASLVIRKKNISRAHFKIVVVEEPNADPTDPCYRPRLTIVNTIPEGKKAVSRRMDRADGQPAATLNPNEIVDVDEGNVIHVVLDVRMTARWVQVACLAPPTRGLSPPDPLEYGPLGISVRPTSHPGITHHLTPTIALTAELALSLVSLTSLVTPNWLVDLIKAGQAERGELSALETTFLLPSVDKYRPAFSQTLPSSLKELKKWAPNEARASLFRDFRFVFIGEKGREVQEAVRELVKRGLGEYECVAVEGGRAALRKVLWKGRAKGRILVLVAEESVLVPAVGNDGWEELVDEAKSFEVNFTSRERILEAVVEADASLLNPNATQSTGPSVQEGLSLLPNVVPNTHPEEPSIPPANELATESQNPMRSRLRRRADSRASSRAPSPPPAAPSQAPPSDEAHLAEQPKRRGLIRRAGRSRMVDDLSVDPDGDGPPAPSSEPTSELVRAPSIDREPTPSRSRLKRRAGTHAADTDIIDLTSDVPAHGADEPPLKKFRALFEESDPNRLQSQLRIQSDSVTQSESVATQSETRARLGGVTQLAAVEEEEESTSGATQGMDTQRQGMKRKGCVADEDAELEDAAAPASKRRAVEGAHSVQPFQTQGPQKPPSRTDTKPASKVSQSQKAQKATGAAPGKPDTDEAFLKAVASTKKGKRTEDTFDREFNNLRISKPELEQAQERDAWVVLDDLGDDRDLRGNFMVILEMEVPEKPRRPALVREDGGRTDWAGRADFKKFKKKSATSRGPAVEVYAEDENDYELSSQLWKGSQARSQLASQSQPLSQEVHKPESSQSRRLRTRTQTQRTQAGETKAKTVVLDDDSDEEAVPTLQLSKSQRKETNRASSTQPRMKTLKPQPLFIGSDEEVEVASQTMADDNSDLIEEVDVLDEDEESVLRPSGRKMHARVRQSNKAGGSKRSAPVILDDDSDDEAAFVGFVTRINASSK